MSGRKAEEGDGRAGPRHVEIEMPRRRRYCGAYAAVFDQNGHRDVSLAKVEQVHRRMKNLPACFRELDH